MGGVPRGHHWGVDSFDPLNKPTGPAGKSTLFEHVVKLAGAVPAFWGRYIGVGSLKRSEVDFLRRASSSTRLLLIYNAIGIDFFEGTPPGTRPNPDAERRRGVFHANRAHNIVQGISKDFGGVPDRVHIYANLEPPVRKDGTVVVPGSGIVSSDWILGWWLGFGPGLGFLSAGLYGNTNALGRFAIGAAYEKALKKGAGILSGMRPPLWAQNTKRVTSAKPADINFGYEPQDPPLSPGASKVWQYAVSFGADGRPAPVRLGLFDTDLATQAAFDGMWKLPHLPRTSDARERPPLDEEQLK